MIEPFDVVVDMPGTEIASALRRRLLTSGRFMLAVAMLLLVITCFCFARRELAFSLPFAATISVLTLYRWYYAPEMWLRMQPHLGERKVIHVSPDCLKLTTPSVKSELPWTYFLCWSETTKYFMLDLTPGGFCSILPKSAMNAEQQQAFRTWAAAKLPVFPKRLPR